MNSPTLQALRTAASVKVYERGLLLILEVDDLKVKDESAAASVQGTLRYFATLSWDEHRVWGECTCPYTQFCKHLVAVGLAVRNAAGDRLPATTTKIIAQHATQLQLEQEARDRFAQFLQRASHETLAQLCGALWQQGSTTRSTLLLGALCISDPAASIAMLRDQASRAAALVPGEDDDLYGLELEERLVSLTKPCRTVIALGRADAARQAIELFLKVVCTNLNRGWYNGGEERFAIRQALEFHRKTAKLEGINQTELGQWFAEFRGYAPAYCTVRLSDYIEAMGDNGLRMCLTALAAPDTEIPEFRRRELLLEIADMTNDTDAAIDVLAECRPPKYGQIVTRLLTAARIEEAQHWINRALESKCVTEAADSDEFVGAVSVATRLRDLNAARLADQLLQAAFAVRPTLALYRELRTHTNDPATTRVHALEAVRRQLDAQRAELTDEVTASGDELCRIAHELNAPELIVEVATLFDHDETDALVCEALAHLHPEQTPELLHQYRYCFTETLNVREMNTAVRLILQAREFSTTPERLQLVNQSIDILRRRRGPNDPLVLSLDRNGLFGTSRNA